MTGRWTYRVSAAGVLVLAAAAFTLSYDALHQLALDSQVRPGLAWLWPVVIDGTIVVGLLTVLAAKRHRQGRLSVGAGRAVLPGVGRFQHRSCSRPPRRPAGVRHGPSRPGPHHPPAHAAGRLATGDARPPSRTRPRTHGRTPAPAGRPPRTRTGKSGPKRTSRRSCQGPVGLRSPGRSWRNPDRSRPGSSCRRQRTVRAAAPRRVQR